jgi:hypothetical protein
MGVIRIHCESCKEILHEDEFTCCIICENKVECNDCKPSDLTFKKNEHFVCKECICEPYKYATEIGIVDIAKDLKMSKKAFLKVLTEEKDLSYGPEILIEEFNIQIEKLKKDIEALNDKINKQENNDFIYKPAILIYLYNDKMEKHKKDIEELNDKIKNEKLRKSKEE